MYDIHHRGIYPYTDLRSTNGFFIQWSYNCMFKWWKLCRAGWKEMERIYTIFHFGVK